jgi:hypothetical protein
MGERRSVHDDPQPAAAWLAASLAGTHLVILTVARWNKPSGAPCWHAFTMVCGWAVLVLLVTGGYILCGAPLSVAS